MKTHLLKTVACALCLGGLLLGGIAPASAEEDSSLGDKMEQMEKVLGVLKRQINNGSRKDTSLALVAKLKSAATAARGMVPQKARTIPQDKRAEFIDDYKAAIDDLIGQMDKLAAAVKDGNAEAQQAALKEIDTAKSDGHVTYRTKQSEDDESSEGGKGRKRAGKEKED